MRGNLIERFTQIFRHILHNPHLIKADDSYSLEEIWKGLTEKKVYSPSTGFFDGVSSLDKYVRLYIDLKKEWHNEFRKVTGP